jgi:uncharacterized membrane protein
MTAVRVLELMPRCSLTPAGARMFVAIVGATTLGVAALFALQGLWPVLLLAGLESALLAWAVRTSLLAGSKRETIAIDEQSITIRRRSAASEHFLVFPRHGSKVKLHAPSTALCCEVGRFLTEDERRTLAARLKQLVGTTNEPPAL